MTQTIDKPLLYTALILLAGGLLILASASIAVSYKNFGAIHYYTLRQFLYGGLVGATLFFIALATPYRFWKKMAVPMMIASFILLALLFIPELGFSSGGAQRWLTLGPLTFQPSEILKFSFIIYLASWLETRKQEIGSISYGIAPFSIMLGAIAIFLIMQPDFGTLGVIIASAVMLYFLGGGKISQITTLFIFGLISFYFLIQLAPYRHPITRILVFLNPALDPQGAGYQISQSLIAIGSGGFLGLGFGKGVQKYSFLPEPMGDSIFAIFSEETGFLGAIILISLFVFLLWRGLHIAKYAPDTFGKLMAAGISMGIAVQAFINMAAISGLLPLTGIPLPFISFGGTSLAMTLGSIGVLLNISKHT